MIIFPVQSPPMITTLASYASPAWRNFRKQISEPCRSVQKNSRVMRASPDLLGRELLVDDREVEVVLALAVDLRCDVDHSRDDVGTADEQQAVPSIEAELVGAQRLI